MNEEKVYCDVRDVMKIMGISESVAYAVIRQLNDELKKMNKLTVRGKVNRKYLMSKLEV